MTTPSPGRGAYAPLFGTLIVLILLIFGPPLFIDFEDLANVPEDKPFSNHTVAPPPGVTGPQRPQGPQKPLGNQADEPADKPEPNRPEVTPGDNSLTD